MHEAAPVSRSPVWTRLRAVVALARWTIV